MSSTHLSLHYRVVFGTKNHEPTIQRAWRGDLHAYLGGIIRAANGRENGQQPLPGRRVRSKICAHIWEQVKTAYAAGIGLREIARKMGIPEGTVLAHAKRHGWTQQIQVATGHLVVMQSDAIAPMQSVPESLAAILSERKERTRLGLSKFTAEAAEQAAEHRDKLGIAGKVKDVADVHKTLWPNQPQTNQILNLGVLIGAEPVRRLSPDSECQR